MRTYVADLPGGTATTTIQAQEAGTLKSATLTFLSAAAGKIELSLAPSSQIGTGQPTKEVIARVNTSATAGNVVVNIPLNLKVKAFDSIYVHQTGAGNLGSVTLAPQ